LAIVLLGIVSVMVASFASGAMQSYFDAERRTELVDTTETAMRRLQRDVRLALPNSIRTTVVGTTAYLEFLPIVTGGRYRAELAGATPPGSCGVGTNNLLQFGVADSSFVTLGPVSDLPVSSPTGARPTNYLVVYNLGPGFSNADAYASGSATGGNKALLSSTSSSACESTIAFASHTFSLASPAARFHIVSRPVTYACDLATGQLLRYGNYNIAAAQPTPPAGVPALVLDGVSACTLAYDANALSQRLGIVSIRLTRTLEGESIRLSHDVMVDNAP